MRLIGSEGVIEQAREDPFEAAERAAEVLSDSTGVEAHDVAVVLGSGWADVLSHVGELRAELSLSTLPGFPAPQVAGHRDVVRSMLVDGRHILVLGGRSHLYEGVDVSTVVHGVRVAAAVGCKAVVLTNAAGSLRPEWPVGQPVLVADHLNLTGRSPMVGPTPPTRWPGRFCDLTNAYSDRLREVAYHVDPTLSEGVYAGLLGGNYETPAEITMLATLGADLVGMSTVLETIAARHLGLEVLAISLVTNLAAGLAPSALSHGEVLGAAQAAEARLGNLLGGILENLWFGPRGR